MRNDTALLNRLFTTRNLFENVQLIAQAFVSPDVQQISRGSSMLRDKNWVAMLFQGRKDPGRAAFESSHQFGFHVVIL